MLTEEGPQVLEFNVRFGDPETQAILFRLESDLAVIFQACLEDRLNELVFNWNPQSSVCVVGASQGYPGAFRTDLPVDGIDRVETVDSTDLKIFFAGVNGEVEKKEHREEYTLTYPSKAQLTTAGGRVLGVTALAESLEQARIKAYQAIRKIQFEGMTFRDDIGVPYGLPMPARSH